FREGGDNDLVGHPGALQEVAGIEGGIGANNIQQPLGDLAVTGRVFLNALFTVDLGLSLGRWTHVRLLALTPGKGYNLVLANGLPVALARLLLGLVALKTALLMAGSPTENAAQLEEDHDRQNEKQ